MSDEEKMSPLAKRAIIIVLVVMALLAVYSNVQRMRRDKLEQAIVTRLETPSPSPSAIPH